MKALFSYKFENKLPGGEGGGEGKTVLPRALLVAIGAQKFLKKLGYALLFIIKKNSSWPLIRAFNFNFHLPCLMSRKCPKFYHKMSKNFEIHTWKIICDLIGAH